MDYSEWFIPGLGEAKSDCGKVVSMRFCDNCGHHEPVGRSCDAWTCPVCYYNAVKRAADKMDIKLDGTQAAYSSVGSYPGRVCHMVLSPSAKDLKNKCYDQLYSKMRKCIDLIGVLGGYVVPHPFEIKGKYKSKLYKYCKSNSILGGEWRAISHDPLVLGDWRAYVKTRLHFHIVGYYPHIITKFKEFKKLTNGWIYVPFEFENRNVYETCSYELAHAGVRPGHIVYRPFGLLSSRYIHTERKITKEYVNCPKCDSEQFYHVKVGQSSYDSFKRGEWTPKIIPIKDGGADPRVRRCIINYWFVIPAHILSMSGSYRGQLILDNFINV